MNKEQENNQQSWVTVEWNAERDFLNRAWWDKNYGEGNWRLIWRLPNPSEELLDFDQLFALFVDSYAKFFEDNPSDALFLTNHFSYARRDYLFKEEAFDPHASYDQKGRADQFYHVAVNWALTKALGLEFKGREPVEGNDLRFWRPSQIPPHPKLVPSHPLYPTLHDFYKKAQELQVKKSIC